jgi:hypothetical protein
MEFLGSCKVCGKLNRNYVALSQHFRFNQDTDHYLKKNLSSLEKGIQIYRICYPYIEYRRKEILNES